MVSGITYLSFSEPAQINRVLSYMLLSFDSLCPGVFVNKQNKWLAYMKMISKHHSTLDMTVSAVYNVFNAILRISSY